MTREEFGAAIVALMTPDQVAQLERLHDEVPEFWGDGCAAHGEGADCCVDAIVTAWSGRPEAATSPKVSEVDHG